MSPFQGHQALEGKDTFSHPPTSLRMESQTETSHLILPHEENMLSESCTQTDSLSNPITFEFGTQTDDSVSAHLLENQAAGFVSDVSDTKSVSTTAIIVTGFNVCYLFCPPENTYLENGCISFK